MRVLDPWWSPNYNAGGNACSGITVHHSAGTSFDNIGSTFQDAARQTSAHWGVGQGIAQQYVAEGDIAWHTGNAEGNRTTIGIECLNSGGEADGWPVSDETVTTLCELMAEIAKRNNMGNLVVGSNIFGHKDWSATACPGVLYDRLQEIADRVNAINAGISPQGSEDDMQCIYQPNGQSYLVWYDGNSCHPLAHPDEVTAINMVHKQCTGRDIPVFALGQETAPWANRFEAAVSRR